MKSNPIFAGLASLLFIFLSACSKDGANSSNQKLSYGDNVIHLKNQADDHIVYPDVDLGGTYEGFPDGIEVDEETGAINVSHSETGLRYRITHTAPNGDTTSVIVVLSGITFFDKFYHLSQNDSIAFPVYNADASLSLPLSGSTFDEGNLANGGGCSVKTNNGQINLKETIRNGVFGGIPRNDERKEFEIRYRLNDESGKSLNRLKVLLYYYDTMADVPQDVWETLNERQDQGVFLQANHQTNTISFARSARDAKPRPPCVIIIGQ